MDWITLPLRQHIHQTVNSIFHIACRASLYALLSQTATVRICAYVSKAEVLLNVKVLFFIWIKLPCELHREKLKKAISNGDSKEYEPHIQQYIDGTTEAGSMFEDDDDDDENPAMQLSKRSDENLVTTKQSFRSSGCSQICRKCISMSPVMTMLCIRNRSIISHKLSWLRACHWVIYRMNSLQRCQTQQEPY